MQSHTENPHITTPDAYQVAEATGVDSKANRLALITSSKRGRSPAVCNIKATRNLGAKHYKRGRSLMGGHRIESGSGHLKSSQEIENTLSFGIDAAKLMKAKIDCEPVNHPHQQLRPHPRILANVPTHTHTGAIGKL